MKYLYTTEPDELCHEVKPGIFGRPVQTSHQPTLRKLGWKDDPNDLRQNEKEVEQETQTEKSLSVHEQAEALGIATHDADGNKIHHKTLKKLIDEAQADD